ncbi:MAG: thiamine pyrophosphate-binding protein [Candidatus Dormibacteraeota bacterium]|uniref:Thiamine pyrophosphate-binding protein n=1 Tax=Candidatus Dormiibacter inghamiae TaxID=3127013 RepID=A0A934KD03_9BACT|nr:thiamine pyrophosphate-binding protein [Candidatus Dormibacteraeota bacterium]MBJ7606243.1 thiamine pyrophosphate-binding protein [Candidatus Dormibacteraeota bacterium]
MNTARAVGQTLVRLGVEEFFGVIGSGNLVATNAMVAAGARFYNARHEGGAITMADAYSRVTGRVGLCTVHHGPGLTNAMTGLTEAVKSRTPLLLVTSDVGARALLSNFRIDQAQLVLAVGAVVARLLSPETAVVDTVRAYRRALAERIPVVLMMPLDVQQADCPEPPAELPPLVALPPSLPDQTALKAAAALLAEARRPLIIAGRGAVLAGAGDGLEHLAEQIGALLATSAPAKDYFQNNRWSLGISGGFSSDLAAELIAHADVVLSAGASLNMWTTRQGSLLSRQAKVIAIDSDARALGHHHRVDLALVGDARATGCGLSAQLPDRAVPGWRSDELGARIAGGSWLKQPYQDESTPERIDPRTLSLGVGELLPREVNVATDGGHFCGNAALYWTVPEPAAFAFTQNFQVVGIGLATGIGAAIGRPDRLTVTALGDGGALMGISELETVSRFRLGMLIVVFNDAAFGAEVHHFQPLGEDLSLVRFEDTDFARLARAAGLDAVTVRRREDLAQVREWLAGSLDRSLLVDAKVVPTVVAPWLEEAFKVH